MTVAPDRAVTYCSTAASRSGDTNQAATGRPTGVGSAKHAVAPPSSPTQPIANPIQGPYTNPAAMRIGGDGSGATTAWATRSAISAIGPIAPDARTRAATASASNVARSRY